MEDARLRMECSKAEIEKKLEWQVCLTEAAENARSQAERYIKEEKCWRVELERQLETQIGLVKGAKQAQELTENELKMETNKRVGLERELDAQVRLAEKAIQAGLRSEGQLEEERHLRKQMEWVWVAAEDRAKEEYTRRLGAERQLGQQTKATEKSRIIAELRVEKETHARQIAERELAEYAEMLRASQAERDVFMRLVTEARIQVMIEVQKRTEIEERLREQDQLVSHLQARILVEQGRWNSGFSEGQPGMDVSMSSIPDGIGHPPDMDASMSSILTSDTSTSIPARTPSPPLSNNPPFVSTSAPRPQAVPPQAQTPAVSSDSASESLLNNSPRPDFRSPSPEPLPPVTNHSGNSDSACAPSPPTTPASSAPLREKLTPTLSSSRPYIPPPLPEGKNDWFELYESRWQGIRSSNSPASSLTFAHFPWPVFRFINSVDELREQEIKNFFNSKYPGALDRKWKEELRRWHTDKLAQMLGRIPPSCAAEVEEGFLRCIKVITAINAERG